MGGATAGSRDFGVDALLATRARFHLLYRLASRVTQLTAADGAAHHSRPWQLAVIGFVALDVGLWAVLRNPRRFALKSRLALDVVDIALWSVGPYPPHATFDAAVLVGVPLAMEAGLRLRWRGFVVPAAVLAGTATARLAAGLPVRAFTFSWLVVAVAGGMFLRGYDGRLRREVERQWTHHRSADDERAYLAGQNSVAMGASSVVDGIEGLVPLLGVPVPGSALWALAGGWKAELGRSTSEKAVYLGVALAEWSAEHNRHPDLSTRVDLMVPEGVGTTLLTGTQVPALWRSLTALGMRGRCTVEPLSKGAEERPPGNGLHLRVGDAVVDVPADRRRSPRPCDPAPLAFVLLALQMARDSSSSWMYVPPSVAAFGIGVCVLASAWSHVRLRRWGRAARREILVVATLVAAAHALACDLTMRHSSTPAGAPIQAFGEGLLVVLLLLGLYGPGMRPAERCLFASGAVVVAGLGWCFHPHQGASVAALLQPWLVSVYFGGRRLARELEAAESAYGSDLRSGDDVAAESAFRRGRASVIELVGRAHRDAVAQLQAVGPGIDHRLSDAARRRLDEVADRLAVLRAGVDATCPRQPRSTAAPREMSAPAWASVEGSGAVDTVRFRGEPSPRR